MDPVIAIADASIASFCVCIRDLAARREVGRDGAFGRATIKSNLKNTCRQFQTIIGRKMDDPIVQEEQFWQLAPIVEVTSSLINSWFSDGVISLNPSLSVFARECIPSIQCLDRMKQGKKEKSGTTLHEAKY